MIIIKTERFFKLLELITFLHVRNTRALYIFGLNQQDHMIQTEDFCLSKLMVLSSAANFVAP